MIRLLLVVIVMACMVRTAGAAEATSAAFETLKSFTGRWTLVTEGKRLSIDMTYETGSNGTIVTERFGQELSVFHRDGDSLLMTHFCNVGNQPRLKLVSDAEPNLLEFDMIDITNLKEPTAGHVQKIRYKIIDADKIGLELVWKRGTEGFSEDYILERQRS